jgi:quinoprotein glucose dehydrogenase
MRVLRLTETAGQGGDPTIVVDGLPVGTAHSGGALRIGPDGMLYLTKGDAQLPERAQDPRSVLGKILRYRPDGTVPVDNPSRGSPVWASGLRDPEGVAWHPATGDLFVVDHGPNGLEAASLRTDHDELNAVPPGSNLGWPIVVGYSEGGPYISPVRTWVPAVAPGGLEFFDVESSPWFGNAFVTGLRGTSLRRLELEESPDGWSVVCEDVLLDSAYGRLRLIRMGPDGALWVGTSNRDQGGLPRENSDLILRLHSPVPSEPSAEL